jgi:hypothetical protein
VAAEGQAAAPPPEHPAVLAAAAAAAVVVVVAAAVVVVVVVAAVVVEAVAAVVIVAVVVVHPLSRPRPCDAYHLAVSTVSPCLLMKHSCVFARPLSARSLKSLRTPPRSS